MYPAIMSATHGILQAAAQLSSAAFDRERRIGNRLGWRSQPGTLQERSGYGTSSRASKNTSMASKKWSTLSEWITFASEPTSWSRAWRPGNSRRRGTSADGAFALCRAYRRLVAPVRRAGMSDGPAAAGNSSKLASPPPGTNRAGTAGRRHDRFRALVCEAQMPPVRNTRRCRDRRGKQDGRSQRK